MKKLFEIFSKSGKCRPLSEFQEDLAPMYKYFRKFLEHNKAALNSIADMEQIYYSGKPFSLISIMKKYQELSEAVLGLIYNLDQMTDNQFPTLKDKFAELDKIISQELTPYVPLKLQNREIILPLENILPEMKCIVGGKAANLASIKNSLGLPVPHGFSITAHASEEFLKHSGLVKPIMSELSRIKSLDSVYAMRKMSENLKNLMMQTPVPPSIAEQIMAAYEELEKKTHKDVRIAMRSSAIGEDAADASFAGQYVSILNVTKDSILEAYKTVLASKYSTRAINYRLQYGLSEQETPMSVLAIAMVNSKASGVAYTLNPSGMNRHAIKISSIWGIGEHLVGGGASPDIFLVDRTDEKIIEKSISIKDHKIVLLESGGVNLVKSSENEKEIPSIDDETVFKLRRYSLLMEEFFQSPQDIEWAVDHNNNLFILQSRPLKIPTAALSEKVEKREFPDNPILLSSGRTASSGISTGKIFVVNTDDDLDNIPENAILVAKTASPDYVRVLGKIKGIITDVGSITSHLSSVAREFEIPFIVDTKKASATLKTGETVTVFADHATVYKGVVQELIKSIRPTKKMIYESPVHQKTQQILNLISPLNLLEPASPSFTPEGCKTIHDIVRFSHENAMKVMFGIAKTVSTGEHSLKLNTNIPLDLYIMDLGGGLNEGLTTCDTITPEKIQSLPMKAIWKGFSHPGIRWSGDITVDMKKFMSLLVSSTTSEFPESLDITSYAIVSKDYLNLSARFGYHFATIDTLCGENSDQNYISLQFAGGAGSYSGRSMRVQFLGKILERLNLRVNTKGDLLEANLARYDKDSIVDKLEQVGRLLASSRLLDLVISNQDDIERLTQAFLSGEYDFLSQKKADQPADFYIHGGYWSKIEENGNIYCIEDGSKVGFSVPAEVAGMITKLVGHAFQDFLDNIEAYFYFPLAIAKNSEMSDGKITLRVKPQAGNIDRAGGIAFGLKDVGNYFVFRINALEDNVMLFEYINNKRIPRAKTAKKIESHKWYELTVVVKGSHMKGFVDNELVIEYDSDHDMSGYAGIWTKADSVTMFDRLVLETKGKKTIFNY